MSCTNKLGILAACSYITCIYFTNKSHMKNCECSLSKIIIQYDTSISTNIYQCKTLAQSTSSVLQTAG